MPSFAAPRASVWLFALGATVHGAIDRRASMRSNHGVIASASKPRRPNSRSQNASVAGGVRNELVQLTVVPPPTQRPCRMVIALSAVLRLADSWYRSGYASRSSMRKSRDERSGPSSRRTMRSPACARISAAVPPPAPLPTMTTSASSAMSRSAREASITLQPPRNPCSMGSAIVMPSLAAAPGSRWPATSLRCHTRRRTSAHAARRMRPA